MSYIIQHTCGIIKTTTLIPICKSCHNNITKNKIVHRKTKTSKGMALIKE